MSLAVRFQADVLRQLAATSITNMFMGIGTAMIKPIRMIVLQNLTDQIMIFSFNGVTDHLVLPASGYIVLDITGNKTIDQGFFLAEGQRVYVRTGTTTLNGSVYLSTFYGAD